MYGAVMNQLDGVDIFIAAAAVADYRAEYVAEKKIKKTEDTLTVNLVKNPDILREVAASAQRPFCVGFAAETNDLEQYATDKLNDKQLDMIAANWVGDQQGFDTEDNALLVIWSEGQTQLPQQPKRELAKQLMTLIEEHYHAKTTTQSS
jgi:phosphopantothenoylcysteine decarboxylase/phosphopantothenate--cysteine ligase